LKKNKINIRELFLRNLQIEVEQDWNNPPSWDKEGNTVTLEVVEAFGPAFMVRNRLGGLIAGFCHTEIPETILQKAAKQNLRMKCPLYPKLKIKNFGVTL
jgi:hypothetical protein